MAGKTSCEAITAIQVVFMGAKPCPNKGEHYFRKYGYEYLLCPEHYEKAKEKHGDGKTWY